MIRKLAKHLPTTTPRTCGAMVGTMMKRILITGLIVCLVCGVGSAATEYHVYYSDLGDSVYTQTTTVRGDSVYYHNNQSGVNFYLYYYVTTNDLGSSHYYAKRYQNSANTVYEDDQGSGTYTWKGSTLMTYYTINDYFISYTQIIGGNPTIHHTFIASEYPFGEYYVSGNTCGITGVDLYIKNEDLSYTSFNDTSLSGEDSYSFMVLANNTYKLIFNDAHEYEFSITNESVTYDRDVCSHTIYRFEESCGNLIPDSEGMACAEEPELFYCYDWEAPTGIYDLSNSSIIKLELYTQTFIGQTGWIIDPVESGYTYTLENPNIAWNLKVIVQNESDDTLIDGAMVKVDQACYCTDGYSTRQKMTVNGMVEYGDMSLQDASLMVMATGYKILDENTTGYSAFLSGRSNFSSKTWIVKMAPSSSNNTSTFYEVSNKVDIHFRDVGGNRTSQILDTDAEVYLYYENNNSNEEAMTLKFQSSSTHTHFIDVDSWTIAYDDIGHKTIPQADFTPWDYSYRAVIYNSSIYGWNMTIPLTVRNATKEETLHYENLTTNLWFRHESDGKIDYREDMQIVSHARSNNTTLMNIDLEVWKDGALLCYKNLTETDYAGATFPYYYVYEPVFDYVSGSNYTAKMYGFDRTLLEVRYLECINDTITRKNRLTVAVKDRTGANLDNCYVYLEGWGSLATGTTYYNAYEGIDNGYYRYKATKSGYSGDGWSDVTISDDDQIVWYTLTEDHTNTSATQQKLTDDDVKAMFFPLMFFLLICIIFGGFKYVSQ